MPLIDHIISTSNLELVRTRIAFILADELTNQATLINEGTPTDDQQITLDSLPSKVYEERFIRPAEGEFPMMNVVLVSNPLSSLTGFEQQTDIARFNIEIYSEGISSDGTDGDTLATIKLQRLLMLSRSILMDQKYRTLNFEKGFIGKRTAADLNIAQPEKGLDSGYVINGQISLMVQVYESQEQLQGTELNESATEQLLSDEKGFYYEIIT